VTDLSKYFKDKSVLYSLAFLFVIGSLTAAYYFSNSEPEESDDPVQYYQRKEITPEGPLRRDFLYSQLGYRSDVYVDDYGTFYFLAVHSEDLESDSGVLFVERYDPLDGIPHWGTGYAELYKEGQEWQAVVESLKSIDDNRRVLKEDNFNFYIILDQTLDPKNGYKESPNNILWANINFAKINFPNSWMDNNLHLGMPTEWLRKNPYNKEILQHYNVDISDDFFDRFNMWEIINIKHKSDNDKTIQVKVMGNNLFRIEDHMDMLLDLESLNKQLDSMGYNKLERGLHNP